MVAWRMREANDTWEDVCERGYSGEPQYLTRDGVSYRIVISPARHDAETQKQRSVFETPTSCPCDLSKLVGESIRLGKTRLAVDAQLAATALVNGMVLVTRNEKDFDHTGVQVLNPFAK